ncbi:MAG: hypothetical protein KDK53_16885 [Maritimibacter sp.]|nr:hypothetical protein [Maritimibacter sp.]
MKTVENTPTRLGLEHRPTALAVGLVLVTLATLAFAIVLFARGNDAGVIFLCFALSPPVFAWFFVETRRITFDRTAGTVTLDFVAPRGTRSTTHALSPDARVSVERPGPTQEARHVPEEGAPGSPTRAVLTGADGAQVPLAEGYSKGPEAYQLRQVVNAWLDTPPA